MNIWNALGLVITAVAFVVVMKKLSPPKPTQSAQRTQDIFNFSSISDDGFIKMPNGIYRAMLEVEPVNMYLKTPEEQAVIWMQFRNMLNSIHVPITILVQSRHKDIKSYVAGIRQNAQNITLPGLSKFGYELASYLEEEIVEKYVKDHRYYVMLEIDPNIQDTELDIPSEAVTQLVTSFKKPLSPDEAEDVARQELMDNMAIIASMLNDIGLTVYRLDKNAILEMSYSALNRDLAPVADFGGIIHASSIQTHSLTKQLIDQDKEATERIRREKDA